MESCHHSQCLGCRVPRNVASMRNAETFIFRFRDTTPNHGEPNREEHGKSHGQWGYVGVHRGGGMWKPMNLPVSL